MAEKFLEEAVALQAKGELELASKRYRSVDASQFLARCGPHGTVKGPDFLIIGAPRAGTTWLKKMLARNSAVRILAGEVHYFSWNSCRDPRAYVETLATGAVKNAERSFAGSRIFGEKSPSYLAMSTRKISLAASLFPDVRIIVSVREPIERAWSDIMHRGQDLDFRSAKFSGMLLYGHYADCLRRWAALFRPSQIHLIDFAEIEKDPERVYSELQTHIGAPVQELKLPKSRVPSRPTMPPELRRILENEYKTERYDLPFLRSVIEHAWQTSKAGSVSGSERRCGR